MAVAAEFNVDLAGIINPRQGFENWNKVHVPFPEKQMIMYLFFHILQVDIDNIMSEILNDLTDILFCDKCMTQIQSESESIMVDF